MKNARHVGRFQVLTLEEGEESQRKEKVHEEDEDSEDDNWFGPGELQSGDTKSRLKSDLEITYDSIKFGAAVGEGTFGVVYRGTLWGQDVALKVLRITTKEQHIKDFKQEVKIMKTLRHPNIVQFLGVCVDPSGMCIVSEYCSGGSLEDMLHRMEKRGKKLSISRILSLSMDIALGLNWLHHRGIIHRDLKTANILLDKNGRCKIGDFGLAYVKKHRKNPKQPGKPIFYGKCGTPCYMAPEVIKRESYGVKADVFSFAIVLCELLYGRYPYADDPNETTTAFEDRIAAGSRPPLDKIRTDLTDEKGAKSDSSNDDWEGLVLRAEQEERERENFDIDSHSSNNNHLNNPYNQRQMFGAHQHSDNEQIGTTTTTTTTRAINNNQQQSKKKKKSLPGGDQQNLSNNNNSPSTATCVLAVGNVVTGTTTTTTTTTTATTTTSTCINPVSSPTTATTTGLVRQSSHSPPQQQQQQLLQQNTQQQQQQLQQHHHRLTHAQYHQQHNLPPIPEDSGQGTRRGGGGSSAHECGLCRRHRRQRRLRRKAADAVALNKLKDLVIGMWQHNPDDRPSVDLIIEQLSKIDEERKLETKDPLEDLPDDVAEKVTRLSQLLSLQQRQLQKLHKELEREKNAREAAEAKAEEYAKVASTLDKERDSNLPPPLSPSPSTPSSSTSATEDTQKN